MKELSIQEKAQRYDKAIKRVEDIETGKCQKPFMFTEGLFDYIFPELKESEDKRIRKELLAVIDDLILPDEQKERFVTWLEKQGEQKPQGKTALEAIKEEKVDNANKVEPRQEKLTEFEKFERAVKQVMEEAVECGDTHNLKADADMLLNLIQKPDEEYNITGIHSRHAKGKLGEMIKNLINAKPRYSIGDVLCDKSCTTLNKDAQPNFEIVTIKDGLYICDKGYIPISQQDEYELVAKKIEQKSAWSEEDEKRARQIERIVYNGCTQKLQKQIADWLKSLKDRVQPQSTWKPSDEQLKAQKGKEV